jgi:hypothetical protein
MLFKGSWSSQDGASLRLVFPVIVAGVLTLLTACTVGPNYVRPTTVVPTASTRLRF